MNYKQALCAIGQVELMAATAVILVGMEFILAAPFNEEDFTTK